MPRRRVSFLIGCPLTANAEGDAAAGEKVFAHCAPCHSTKPGENKLGPSLAGVFGRKAGTEPGFSYSSALKGQNITWGSRVPASSSRARR